MLRNRYLCFLAFLVLSCNYNGKNERIFNIKYYKRITSPSDSLKNMYVVYNSTLDSNYKMFKFYWNNGNVQTVSFFYKTIRIGPWTSYFDNGKISSEQHFNDGKKDGEYKLYFMNGRVNLSGRYRLNDKIGVWYYFDESGDTIKTEKFSK